MSYVVFARKYRPKNFDDIAGQAHITTTLKNAIAQGRVAHAYIFAGPRGVGKTTTARILAKALDCDKGPTPKPCNLCAACKEISQGSSLDILEIDGASNRGIDEIRNLRDNVKFAPSRGRFRIYIIDEVHMLTPEAFNALLKTLEEPPPHVKFIFATTQPYKIPATILSRCQRFDFKRLATADILKNLQTISKSEALKVSDEALGLIAKYSDGSMRDGQVMLDQITSFTQGAVGAQDVTRILGVVDDEILFGLSQTISQNDASGALKIVDALVNDGKDVFQAVSGLIEHFRNISMAKIAKDLDSLIDAGTEKIKLYKEEAGKFTIENILYVIYTLSNTIDFMRKSQLARIPLEAALVKLTRTGSVMSLAEVVNRIEMLEKSQRQTIDHPSTSLGTSRPKPDSSLRANEKAEAASHPRNDEKTKSSAELDEVLGAWSGIVNYIKNKKISIASCLQEGYPVSLEANALTIGLPKEFLFYKDVLDSPENRHLIAEAVKAVMGLELKIVFILTEPVANKPGGTAPYPQGSDDAGDLSRAADDAANDQVDPIIKSALEIFNGEIKSERTGKARPK